MGTGEREAAKDFTSHNKERVKDTFMRRKIFRYTFLYD